MQIHGRERGDEAPSGSIRMISRTALSSVTVVLVIGENWGKNSLFRASVDEKYEVKYQLFL
jgi:hypothetical protein